MRRNKAQRFLGKRCPECEVGYLEVIVHTKTENGVEYSEEFIECTECDYSKKTFSKRDRNNLNPKW